LQKNQRFGHLFQIVLLRPTLVSTALALGKFRLNVHQQLKCLFLWWLFLMGMMLCLTSQHRLDFFLAVPSTQCLETDKAFLPCTLNGSVFSTLDFIALLFQILQKIFVVGGLLLQNFVDDTAQSVAVAFPWQIGDTLLPFPIRLLFNYGKLMLQTN